MTLVSQHIVLQSPANNDPLLDLNTQPSLDLQFATSKTLDDRVSGLPLVNHQRDASSGKSAGTYVASDGLIKNSAVNLIKYSEQFDQSIWVKQNSLSVTPNAAVAPDGTLTADKVEFTAANQYLSQTSSVNGTVTFSCYVRSVSGNVPAEMFTYNGDVDPTYTTTFTATPEWQRVEVQATLTATGTSFYPAKPSAASGELYVWGAQLQEGALTDYIPTTNLPSGAPRFDHNPVTLQSLGLLIEESRANLLTYSEQFDNGAWVKNKVTITPNSTVSPSGTTTADKIVWANNETSSGSVRRSSTDRGTATNPIVSYTLTGTGTATVLSTLATGSNYNIDPVGNGWYRCWLYDSTADQTLSVYAKAGEFDTMNLQFYINNRYIYALDSVATQGDGTSGIYVWGAQLEAGSFQSSYIPTTTSAVTRAADVASITGTNFSSWYNQSEGTLLSFSRTLGVDLYATATFELTSSNSNAERIALDVTNSYNRFSVYGGGDSGTNAIYGVVPAGTLTKNALAYKLNDVAAVRDGGTVLNDTSVGIPIPNINRAGIGYNLIYGEQKQQHITRLTYYPYRLADATLQEITS